MMSSAKQIGDSLTKQEAAIKTPSQQAREDDDGQTTLAIIQAVPLNDRINEQAARNAFSATEAKPVTIIFPDFFQVPKSHLQANEAFQYANTCSFMDSTAEIAANSPRYRRRSSTFIDGVHDLPDEKASPMAPAQLYSTMSGRLFHSGRIAIVLVGPPARGKT